MTCRKLESGTRREINVMRRDLYFY